MQFRARIDTCYRILDSVYHQHWARSSDPAPDFRGTRNQPSATTSLSTAALTLFTSHLCISHLQTILYYKPRNAAQHYITPQSVIRITTLLPPRRLAAALTLLQHPPQRHLPPRILQPARIHRHVQRDRAAVGHMREQIRDAEGYAPRRHRWCDARV